VGGCRVADLSTAGAVGCLPVVLCSGEKEVWLVVCLGVDCLERVTYGTEEAGGSRTGCWDRGRAVGLGSGCQWFCGKGWGKTKEYLPGCMNSLDQPGEEARLTSVGVTEVDGRFDGR
jgi:hypothetical protein